MADVAREERAAEDAEEEPRVGAEPGELRRVGDHGEGDAGEEAGHGGAGDGAELGEPEPGVGAAEHDGRGDLERAGHRLPRADPSAQLVEREVLPLRPDRVAVAAAPAAVLEAPEEDVHPVRDEGAVDLDPRRVRRAARDEHVDAPGVGDDRDDVAPARDRREPAFDDEQPGLEEGDAIAGPSVLRPRRQRVLGHPVQLDPAVAHAETIAAPRCQISE